VLNRFPKNVRRLMDTNPMLLSSSLPLLLLQRMLNVRLCCCKIIPLLFDRYFDWDYVGHSLIGFHGEHSGSRLLFVDYRFVVV